MSSEARVDVPTRCPFEPTARRELEPSTVPRALEGRLGDDRVGAHQLQVEAGPEGLVQEAQLHEGRLQQDSTLGQRRQQVGDVFSADVHGGVARVAALEPGQDA